MAQIAIALAALAVSVVAIRGSNKALEQQRKHNIVSMRPDLTVIISDYEDKIRVQLKNNGLGPGRITKQEFRKNGVVENVDKFVDLMPELGETRWTHFCSNTEDVLLAPGSVRNLIEFSGEVALQSPDLVLKIRKALAPLHVSFEYEDYYGEAYAVEKSLDWYSRYTQPNNERYLPV